jgi:HemK-related putative methylase
MATKLDALLFKLDHLRFWPRRVVARRRMQQAVLEQVLHRSFVVLPQVFNPTVFRTGRYLAEFIVRAPWLTPRDANATALDIGTGSGLQAVFLADRGYTVAAVDISPVAVRCAKINVLLHGMEDRIEVLESDLFGEVADRAFDVIAFNPPFFKGKPRSTFDLAWRSEDIIHRFAAGLREALKPNGVALTVWSSHAKEQELLTPLERADLHTKAASRTRMGGETLTIFETRCRSSGHLAR